MFSMWIWHKSVQRFPEIFHTHTKLETKDVLNINTNCTQAAKKAEKCHFCQRSRSPFLSLVTLTSDLQTRPSEGPIMSSMWFWCKSVQRFPNTKHGTKHVFHMNLAQIHSAVPEIFYTQKTQTDGDKNRTFRSSLRAVIICATRI